MISFEHADENSALQQFYLGQCAKYVRNINHAMQACIDIKAMYILFARAILLLFSSELLNRFRRSEILVL